MRIVFDLDDTICRTKNRDYVNSAEISAVVSKIRDLRKSLPDAEIIVHTSRGMASCDGDAEAAEAKNRPTVEKWLADHGIEVDEIVFGKPLGDIYVDDKAMTACDFSKAKIHRCYGFSGANVARIGKIIIKEAQNVEEQFEWYTHAKSHYAKLAAHAPLNIKPFMAPTVYSVTLGKLYMQFVPGVVAAKVVDASMIYELVDGLLLEPELEGSNDLNAYAKYVESRAASVELSTDIGSRIRECDALKRRTFCHGDFSLQNILCNSCGYTLIDPSPKPGMETWILDAGKLRASLACLDKALCGISHPMKLLQTFDEYLLHKEEEGVVAFGTQEAVELACESHIIRVWHYARKLGKKKSERIIAKYYHGTYR